MTGELLVSYSTEREKRILRSFMLSVVKVDTKRVYSVKPTFGTGTQMD